MRKVTNSILFVGLCLTLAAFNPREIREEVYLHLNSNFLLTGETMYFAAFVNKQATHQPSALSNVLYVELVSDSGQIVFQNRIKLDSGRGYGDYFIPSTISTGNYQLIAYTRWMRNFADYFQVPVTIVNPFEAYEPPDVNKAPVNLSFHTSTPGYMVAGVENTLSYRASGKYGEPIPFQGKIVNGAGETAFSFDADNAGVGKIRLTPKSGESYQAILEDAQGAFHFFDLPEVRKEGLLVEVMENVSQYLIYIKGTYGDESVKVLVQSPYGTVRKNEVHAGETIKLEKGHLSKTLHQVLLVNRQQDTLCRQVIIPDIPESQEVEKQTTYTTREPIKTSLDVPPGRYSVSVRKVQQEGNSYAPSTIDYTTKWAFTQSSSRGTFTYDDRELDNFKTHMQVDTPTYDQVTYLPEYEGELISGQVMDSLSQPIQGAYVAYAVPEAHNHLSIVETDENGRFLINPQTFWGDKATYFQVIEPGTSYQLSVDSSFLKDYPEMDLPPLYLDSLQIAAITASSVNLQVENAYYYQNPDSVLPTDEPLPLFTFYDRYYNLDEYNRFPQMEDYFVEYIGMAGPRKEGDSYGIKVKSKYYTPQFNEPSLVMLDGVPVNTQRIMAYNPLKIESVGIISNRVYMGSKIFDGVVAFETYDGDLQDYELEEHVVQVKRQGLRPPKQYNFPGYTKNKNPRIPDKREQLFWNPQLTVKNGQQLPLQFSTSDVKGKFVVAIEGFSQSGEAVSIRRYFVVR